ncbi:MAG: hypothetical protein LBR38_05535 [Synergistaceae bacterium]|jgi:hypothetical protein|nr:hypothetical protein [Synergistaceae bacterium]
MKKRLIVVLVLLGVAVMVQYVFRDIELGDALLREALEHMPGVVMENLEFEREVSGDLWQVSIFRAERRAGVVTLTSVDVSREPVSSGDDQRWRVFGDYGVYSEAGESGDLFRPRGVLEFDGRPIDFSGPRLSYARVEGEASLSFPDGILLSGDDISISADAARVDRSGVIFFDRGGVLRWTTQTKE